MNLNNLTIKSQEAFQKAQQIAFNAKNPNIETEHMLKALLIDDDSAIITITTNITANSVVATNTTKIKVIFVFFY